MFTTEFVLGFLFDPEDRGCTFPCYVVELLQE
jgi:hypothetical protein